MIETSTLDRWTAARAADAPRELVAGTTDDAGFVDTGVRYRPCPRCAETMRRLNFGPGSGVIIDVCVAHGVWLDPGELPRIVAFARRGGLERVQGSTRSTTDAPGGVRRARTTAASLPGSLHDDEQSAATGVALAKVVGTLLRWLVGG